ncbi:enediyne biosynthesis protein UnbU [Polymorphospora sp. NPDC051019]|uniref:enediyne biosynthesis protein UnbU n=1 Tax=Polymorphospora sp. NPDC051019 TaxID=3155725 RepID=UPI0034205A0E
MTTTAAPPTSTPADRPEPVGGTTTEPAAAAAKPPTPPRVKALQRFALSITVFNIVGHLFLGFEQSPITPILALLGSYTTALLMEWVDSRAHGRVPEFTGGTGNLVTFLLPAHIAGLACAMLLWGHESIWPYLFAVTAANASKYVIRLRENGRLRHMLNPSNAGIALTLVVFPWVGIAPPYHFTNNISDTLDWLLPLAVLGAGTMLNAGLTKKIPLIMAWVLGFAAQAFLRWLFLDHSLVGALLPMTGFAFILFTNYMITDPGTTPRSRRGQVIFGLTAAATYSILVLAEVSFGLFFALVITCILRGLILLFSPARRESNRRAAEAATTATATATAGTTPAAPVAEPAKTVAGPPK